MEKTEKLTAEEFFKDEMEKQWRERTSAFSSDPDSLARIPYIIHPAIHKIMHEYADQELAEYKEMIGDILASYEQYGELPSVIIERARKLIDKP